MDAELCWRDAAPGLTAWADLRAPVCPPLADRNPAAVAWRHLLIDPDLIGLVPGRPQPTRIEIGRGKLDDPDDLWRLPLTGVLATPLAWHARLPLVAGLAVRHYRAHPWIADYRNHTVTLHQDIRAATALTGHGHAPLAWCGDSHLALLTSERGSPSNGAPSHPRPVIVEASGPGFITFLPSVAQLKELAAAHVSTLDVTSGTLTPWTEPLLARNLRLARSGDILHVDFAAGELAEDDDVASDGLDRAVVDIDLQLAGRDFVASLIEFPPHEAGPQDLAPGIRAQREQSRQAIDTGYADAYLTWEPRADDAEPVLLWLHASDPGDPPITPSHPNTVATTGFSCATLDLPLHWPPDATVRLLHDQIIRPLRSALEILTGPVTVGGHSFGATLALYGLAHVPELAAAVVHSGCYNRTLTPTGFHREKRQYWDVPDIYQSFSPLHFANRLDRPVLLVHGADDLNPATPPAQAVGLYRAIVAAGGHARLVLLPGEGHVFYYRETQDTLAAEHRDWLLRWGPCPRSALR